jgi:putative oxidoreductase
MDESLLAVLRGLLSAVFVASGAAKLSHPFGAALAMTQFGIVSAVRPSLGSLLGGFELVLGIALFALPAAEVPLACAIVLLAVFTALLGRALARGDSFACACFTAHGVPIGAVTLARTAVLLLAAAGALAVVAASAPSPSWDERLVGAAIGSLLLGQAFLAAELARTKPYSTGLGASEGPLP